MLPFSTRLFAALGGLAGCGAVAMAAVAAHALPQRLDARALAAVQSAVQMQGWHAIALLLTALWLNRVAGTSHALALCAGAAFTLGLLLFCGAIYAHDLGGLRLGPTAPTGGFLLMAGWLLLAASAAFATGPRP
jgi:uncharacterized membrane protein YgdD (TMEM256/DUF423 family)